MSDCCMLNNLLLLGAFAQTEDEKLEVNTQIVNYNTYIHFDNVTWNKINILTARFTS